MQCKTVREPERHVYVTQLGLILIPEGC